MNFGLHVCSSGVIAANWHRVSTTRLSGRPNTKAPNQRRVHSRCVWRPVHERVAQSKKSRAGAAQRWSTIWCSLSGRSQRPSWCAWSSLRTVLPAHRKVSKLIDALNVCSDAMSRTVGRLAGKAGRFTVAGLRCQRRSSTAKAMVRSWPTTATTPANTKSKTLGKTRRGRNTGACDSRQGLDMQLAFSRASWLGVSGRWVMGGTDPRVRGHGSAVTSLGISR